MVIDKNRIAIGSLIILFFLLGYIFNLDLIILLIITFLTIYELYDASFIKNKYDYLILLLFISIFPLIFYNTKLINILNIFLIIFVCVNLFFPNLYLKRFFYICILIFIHNFFSIFYYDRNILYFIIFVAFFNDTIAFIFGKLLKGPLIIPQVSPKKTWSGTTISFILTFFLIYQFNFSLIVAAILSITLFIGDIYFSYIKRKNSLKDFSKILQGHGGILDRLDSMFFFILILNYNFI